MQKTPITQLPIYCFGNPNQTLNVQLLVRVWDSPGLGDSTLSYKNRELLEILFQFQFRVKIGFLVPSDKKLRPLSIFFKRISNFRTTLEIFRNSIQNSFIWIQRKRLTHSMALIKTSPSRTRFTRKTCFTLGIAGFIGETQEPGVIDMPALKKWICSHKNYREILVTFLFKFEPMKFV